MANKTPYEIRADLLVLAHKICMDTYLMRMDRNGAAEIPNESSIIATAKKLNEFVSESPKRTS